MRRDSPFSRLFHARIWEKRSLLPLDLISTAKALVGTRKKRPYQSDLRRATSTAYYALFHCLARCCADALVGGTNSDRSKPAWHQVYRALEHGVAKDACKRQDMMKKFPKEIEDFGNMFVAMQAKRHAADYDPDGRYYKSTVIQEINEVEDVIQKFSAAPLKHRRAFAAFVLFKARR